MRNNFLNRVEAERAVLLAINSNLNLKFQLHGLSQAAIDDWMERKAIADKALIDLVLRAAQITHALADISNEVFNIDEEISSKEVCC